MLWDSLARFESDELKGLQYNDRQVMRYLWKYTRSGAVAGAVSAFTFAAIHHIFISDIWFSLPFMMAAGALCGLCIGWSFALVVAHPSIGSWLRYNALYVAMLLLLGLASVIVYEPVTTIAALIEANEPPGELFGQAFPMTLVFTLASSITISLLYARSWRRHDQHQAAYYGAILLTCTVLVLLLGLNVSALGLVDIPRGSLFLVAELFGLIVAITAVYAAVFIALERKHLTNHSTGLTSAASPRQ